ncbi:21151_t:CDS:2 [Cetraspora pellucida]|uniref:21151_t:CDS:1 n=1 Tax=Cetraspora pellucida TaxID=1433469 RepID=A0A9N9C8V2_9GLOM|nr:21151_t:CDS:2 [Cetraspora pellucida]
METSNLRNKLRKRLPAISENLESKRSEVRWSQMMADTLRSVAEMLQLDTTGSKTDLIERKSTHCPNRRSQQEERSTTQTQTQIDEMRLDNSLTNMFQDDNQDFSDAMEEEIGSQSKGKKRKVNHKDPDSEKTSLSSSDMEIVRHKKALKIEDEWSEERFRRSRDQHEYNLLRSIERDLDLDINFTSTDEATTMNQQKNLIQTDTMIQGTITTQKDTHKEKKERQETTDPALAHSNRKVKPHIISYLLEDKDKGFTSNNRLAKKWYPLISLRITPSSSTTNTKTIQNEHRANQLDKEGTRSDARKWCNKMIRSRASKTINVYRSKFNFSKTEGWTKEVGNDY